MAHALPDHLFKLEEELHKLQRSKTIYTILGIAVTAMVVLFGIDMANKANATPFGQGFQKIFNFPIDMIQKSTELGFGLWVSRFPEFIPSLLATINMAVISTFLGFLMAIVLACLASNNIIKNKAIVGFFRRFMDLLRSFPEIIIALFLLFLMGKSLVPAVIAISLHTAGALGKLFSEAIENIDNKPLEGLQSVGGSQLSRIRFGVFPQVMPLFYSYTILRLEINVRASTILGFFGLGGIGEALSNNIQWRDGGRVTVIFILLITTIIAFDYLSDWIRSKLIGKERS